MTKPVSWTPSTAAWFCPVGHDAGLGRSSIMAQLVNAADLTARDPHLEKLDLPAEDAHIVAEHLVEVDPCGVHSHGVIRVPTYVEGSRLARSTRSRRSRWSRTTARRS
jgi:hypothetical protein